MSTPPIQRSLFPQLPIPNQADVIASLTPHFPLLWQTIMGPWEEFLEYRATDKHFCDLTEDEIGQWLTIQATHRARQLFHGRHGFKLLTWHGKLTLVLEAQLAMSIKKLRRRSRRRGQPES